MPIEHPRFEEVRLDRLSRSFGALNALHEVSLSIRRREFIALLGPSGCGKSTALNCIAGLLPTTGGSIWLDDRRIDGLRPEDRGFGMVFQNYALFPHMNARKNIAFGLKMRGTPKAEIETRVEEAIRLVRLEGHADKLPGQLSGGQQQRVAIARAIVIEPPLVLMDEPLSNLDAKLRLEMRAEIRRIHDELGATTIYVTHDQDEALSLADRIVVLRDGEIRQVGAPKELYDTPAHLDVAEFMGFRNRLSGIVAGRNGDRATVSVNGVPITGLAREPVSDGAPAIIALRPDDLMAGPAGEHALTASVETIEYRGREFVGMARTADGMELVFRSHELLEPGATVHLNAAEDRVLVYADDDAGRDRQEVAA
ncbi:ABC transporter ATP-binding protein [Inquilinus sp. CAU 1745]|uniref:ABC transporter ATP-binding protein n=1 Tax=Inquilinus sp. CAU 1745 TaxID=3140369 RepID=UPI00325B0D68